MNNYTWTVDEGVNEVTVYLNSTEEATVYVLINSELTINASYPASDNHTIEFNSTDSDEIVMLWQFETMSYSITSNDTTTLNVNVIQEVNVVNVQGAEASSTNLFTLPVTWWCILIAGLIVAVVVIGTQLKDHLYYTTRSPARGSW